MLFIYNSWYILFSCEVNSTDSRTYVIYCKVEGCSMKKLLAILFFVLFLSAAGGCAQAIAPEGLDYLLVSDISDELSHTVAQDNTSNAASTASVNGKSDYQFSDDEFNEAKQQAELLTAHLVVHAVYDFYDEKSTFPDCELDNFVLTTFFHSNHPQYLPNRETNDYESSIDHCQTDTKYLYHGFVNKTKDSIYVFPVKKVQQLVYEVFGLSDWILNLDNSDFFFDDEKQQYESGLQFGFGSRNSYKNLTSEIQKDTATIKTTFLLLEGASVNGNPGWKEAGYYHFTFQVMHENDRQFLRFLEMNTDTAD